MAKGIKKNHRTAKTIFFFIAAIVTMGFILACATTNQHTPHQSSEFYGIAGWKGQAVVFDTENNISVAAGIDINGNVGRRLFVEGCHAECVPGRLWNADYRIISGSFPPGMDFAPNFSDIKGVPKKSGHWIVQLELYNIMCNNKSYANIRQELRFHISGGRKVVR